MVNFHTSFVVTQMAHMHFWRQFILHTQKIRKTMNRQGTPPTSEWHGHDSIAITVFTTISQPPMRLTFLVNFPANIARSLSFKTQENTTDITCYLQEYDIDQIVYFE